MVAAGGRKIFQTQCRSIKPPKSLNVGFGCFFIADMEKEAGQRAVRKGRVCECCPSYAASAGDDDHAACVVLNLAGKRPEIRRFFCAVVKPESHFRYVHRISARKPAA